MIGLLDGDIVVFRCGFAAERTVWHLTWGDNESKVFEYKREAMDHLDKVCPGKFSRVEGEDYSLFPEKNLEPLSHALHSVKVLIERICDELALNPEWDLKVFLSSGKNYRHEVAKTRPYKGNRKVEHRPTYEHEIKRYLKENYDTTVAVDEEADDLLGIYQTEIGPEDSIIITIDKDLDQVPGLKYNWVKDVGYNVTQEQADRAFHMQLLTGDTTDNIPGLKGIGPAKAAKLLHDRNTPEEMMAEVEAAYACHAGENWWEYLKEMGQLLWIRRKVGEMWEPQEEGPDPWGEVITDMYEEK